MKSAPLPADEEARIGSLRALKLLDSLPEQQYDDLVHLASAICGTPIALVSLVDERRQWFKAKVGLDVAETPRELAFCAHAILQGELFVVPDAQADPRFSDNPLVTSAPSVRFYAGAPLLSPDGHAIGTLCVIDRVARRLTADQERSLAALARQVTRLLALRTRTIELEEANQRLVDNEAHLRKVTGELRESVARFRSTFDQNAVGLTLTALDGTFLSVNRAFSEMLGYAEAELVGVHVNAITHPDDLLGTAERLASATTDAIHVSKRFLRKDGASVWTESVARRLTDDHDHALYWLSQIQNVTPRKESEERLLAQYTMARVLADAATPEDAVPPLLQTLCTTGRWDMAAIFELDEAEPVLRCTGVESMAEDAARARGLLSLLRIGHGEEVAGQIWATGQARWIEDLSTHPVPRVAACARALEMRSVLALPVMVEGTCVGIVELFARAPRAADAPTRSLAEALCAQIGSFLTRKRSEAMQRRMATVLETTSDFVTITDRAGRLLYLNRAGRKMLEIPPETDVHAIDVDRYMPPWAAALLQERLPAAGREGRWAGDLAYLSASGREIPVSQVTISPPGPDGAPLFFASIARDITEAKKVEQMKNEFVSTVSHELRTPLTSIRGALGLLEGGVVGQIDDAALEIVRIAKNNSDRLIRLVNDMLDLEKIEAGKLEMMLSEASAEALARSAADSVRGMAAQAGVTLKVDVTPKLRARVDVDRMVQVLTNLLSNAVKFSPRGESVRLVGEIRGDRARFEVRDRGPGIPAEARSRLFQKFQQLDGSDARAKGGTGLGLAISKAIVAELGGTIGVDSVPGEGSTFWIELPRLASLPPPQGRPLSARPAGERSAKILVVDDDPSIRAILSRLFETLGVRVFHAPDGALAIHIMRTEAPDLIVLDLGMPRPDGFEVVNILRDDATRGTPLLVYTARELSVAEREELKLGDTRYLTKARASEATLLATVRELLGRGEAGHDL